MGNSQHVVLVDDYNNILGIEEKLAAHNANTKLHRGFSVFLFNTKKEVLLQQRCHTKKTWGGFWSNSFCGHPQINETTQQAIYRHAKFELGLETLQQLHFVSDYRYRFSLGNIVESEICPIYMAVSDDHVVINEQEVSLVKLLTWPQFDLFLKQEAYTFTPWCKEQVKVLECSAVFKNFMHEPT